MRAAVIEDEERRADMLARTAQRLGELRRQIMSIQGDLTTAIANIATAQADIAAIVALDAKRPLTLFRGNVDLATTATGAFQVKLTVPVPGGLVATDGGQVKFKVSVEGAATANIKNLRVQFGGQTVRQNGQAANNNPITFDGYIRRTGAATAKSRTDILYTLAASAWELEQSLTPTWANANDLTFAIQSDTVIGDIVMKGVEVVYWPAVAL